MTQSTEQLQIKAERDLMVRSLDEWVMQTGAVVLNSSWHSELQSIVEMAFNKGAEIEAALRAQVVPQGWKLVPVDPTSEMLKAAWKHGIDDEAPDPYYAYKAMLAAAPQPPDVAPVQMHEPVAYVHVPSLAWGGKVRPVVSFEKYEDDHKDGVYSLRTPLYTEHQVRELLARK